MAKRRFQQRGDLIILPISGATVSEIHLRARSEPILVFEGAYDEESFIGLRSAVVTLAHGGQSQVMEGSKPGKIFSPKTLAPLVELLGCTVAEATVQRSGRLDIVFSGSYALSVVPVDFDGWHFRNSAVTLTGADGSLI